jgi:hypothetical protein
VFLHAPESSLGLVSLNVEKYYRIQLYLEFHADIPPIILVIITPFGSVPLFEMVQKAECYTRIMAKAVTAKFHSKHRIKGWRNAAVVDTCLVWTLSIILSIVLAIAYTHSEEGGQIVVIFTATCGSEKSDTANTVFHLLINILSTAILASSNFFMQVLNATTREELNDSHSKKSWLDIGVPSVRNTFRISRLKTTCWIFFFLSSIPIHLFFNNAVFAIDYRGSKYNLTIAAEPFLHGSPGYWPGAFATSTECFSYNIPLNKSIEYIETSTAMGNLALAKIQSPSTPWKRIEVNACRALLI